MFMLFRDIERRIFSIFKSSNAYKQIADTGQRVVMDFRHLNIRIANNNLAYPLVRDMFLVFR